MTYRSLLLPLLVLVVCGVPTAQAQRVGAARNIPGSMYGTYDLAMDGATSYSPYPDDTEVSLTLAIDGSLCAPGLRLRNPFEKPGIPDTIFWSDENIGLEFSLNVSGAFAGFGIGSPNGNGSTTPFGTLIGEEADTRDACDFNSTFFELAEANYPELFPESIFVLTQLGDTSFYRYYSVTGITLSTANGVAYARGGPFQGTVLLGDVERLVEGGVDELVVPVTEPVVLPAVLTGTYALTFSSAGEFSPVPNGTRYDVALGADGRLCFDGVMLGTPYRDASDANVVNWGNPNAGFTLKLDLDTSAFSMVSDEGLLLGTLGGNRSQLLASCAGVLGDDIDIGAANALFTLAERIYPTVFPASALTFNQFDGTNLRRFYPASDVLVTVTGADVFVSGGPYGSEPRRVGTIASLLQALTSDTPGFIPYSVRVTGNVLLEIGNLPPINRKVDLDEAPVPRPAATDNATLSAHVRQVLDDELKGISDLFISNVVFGANSLQFDVLIDNSARIGSSDVLRTYELHFIYAKQ